MFIRLIALTLAVGLATQTVAAPSNKKLNKKIKALDAAVGDIEDARSPDVTGRRYLLSYIGKNHGLSNAVAFEGLLSYSHTLKFKGDGSCRLQGEKFESYLGDNTVQATTTPEDRDCTWVQDGNNVTLNFTDNQSEAVLTVSNDGSKGTGSGFLVVDTPDLQVAGSGLTVALEIQ